MPKVDLIGISPQLAPLIGWTLKGNTSTLSSTLVHWDLAPPFWLNTLLAIAKWEEQWTSFLKMWCWFTVPFLSGDQRDLSTPFIGAPTEAESCHSRRAIVYLSNSEKSSRFCPVKNGKKSSVKLQRIEKKGLNLASNVVNILFLTGYIIKLYSEINCGLWPAMRWGNFFLLSVCEVVWADRDLKFGTQTGVVLYLKVL